MLPFALTIFSYLKRYFSEKITKCLIMIGGSIAVIESNLIYGHLNETIDISERFHKVLELLRSPGIPLNLDVSLLAVVYLATGFYFKDNFKSFLESKNKIYDVIAFAIAGCLGIFCYLNYNSGDLLYYFDMKPVYYRELVSALLIPSLFMFLLCRITALLDQMRIFKFFALAFAYLGQMSMPIMFLHVIVNNWQNVIGYGRFIYVLLGVGIPVLITVLFQNHQKARKIMGLPPIYIIR